MKQRMEESDHGLAAKTKKLIPTPRSPPPPPPPLYKFLQFPRRRAMEEESVTKKEIAKYWRQKRLEEEDHLLSAIKAAARLRARNLSEEEYLSFEWSLENENDEDDIKKEKVRKVAARSDCKQGGKDKEVRIGIKDWWTKSKYAYLNQPAIASIDPPKKRTWTYIPNCLSYKAKPLYPTFIGVF